MKSDNDSVSSQFERSSSESSFEFVENPIKEKFRFLAKKALVHAKLEQNKKQALLFAEIQKNLSAKETEMRKKIVHDLKIQLWSTSFYLKHNICCLNLKSRSQLFERQQKLGFICNDSYESRSRLFNAQHPNIALNFAYMTELQNKYFFKQLITKNY